MTAKIIDGKALSLKVLDSVREKVKESKETPVDVNAGEEAQS